MRIRNQEVLRAARNVRSLHYKLARLVDDGDLSTETHSTDRVIPHGFRLKKSRSAPLDNCLVKYKERVRLGMTWFGESPHSLAKVTTGPKVYTTGCLSKCLY